jgi:TRAP-type mannitol/chloroaromatic compound transport system permease small subunit
VTELMTEPHEWETAPGEDATASSGEGIVQEFDGWLRGLSEADGSDLHVKVGSPPMMRLQGQLQRMDRSPMGPEETERLATGIVPADRREVLDTKGEVDFAHSVAGLGRFRANVFRQRGSYSMVLRKLRFGGPSQPPSSVLRSTAMRALGAFVRLINATNEWLGRFVSLGVLVMIALVVYEVVMRYGLRAPTVWGMELSSYLFAGYILLGGGYTLLHRDHVNMDVFYSRLAPRGQALLDVLTAGVVFLFCAVLFYEGAQMAQDALARGRRSGTDWNPYLFPVLVTLPLGAFLLLLQAVAKFVRDLVFTLSGRDLLDGR